MILAIIEAPTAGQPKALPRLCWGRPVSQRLREAVEELRLQTRIGSIDGGMGRGYRSGV